MPDVFRRAIEHIMSSPSPVRAVDSAPARPQSHGWMRRSEHDDDRGLAWELPDGEIRLIPHSDERPVGTETSPPTVVPSRKR